MRMVERLSRRMGDAGIRALMQGNFRSELVYGMSAGVRLLPHKG